MEKAKICWTQGTRLRLEVKTGGTKDTKHKVGGTDSKDPVETAVKEPLKSDTQQ
jgi:hypothetical protein